MFYGHFSCSELIGMDSILILFWTGFTGFSGLFVIVHRRDRGLRPLCLQPSYRSGRAQTRGGKRVAGLRHERAGLAEDAEKFYLATDTHKQTQTV
jgi:hypothetical protein